MRLLFFGDQYTMYLYIHAEFHYTWILREWKLTAGKVLSLQAIDLIQTIERIYPGWCTLSLYPRPCCDRDSNMAVVYCSSQTTRALKRVISLLFRKDMAMSFHKSYMSPDRQGVERAAIVFCRHSLEQVSVLVQPVMSYSGSLCRASMNPRYVHPNTESPISSAHRGMFLKLSQWWSSQFSLG